MTAATNASKQRPLQLLFVSPRFLFPADSGGKIRTTQLLKGLNGGNYSVRLVSPGTPGLAERFESELRSVCDEFSWWPEPRASRLRPLRRALYALNRLPISVRSDWSVPAAQLVQQAIARHPDVVVFDFVHSVVLAPRVLAQPTVLFTHNVEAEIFGRHERLATNSLLRALWRDQTRKMKAFETGALNRFDVVVAVSDRDARAFQEENSAIRTVVIPTGVDPEYFRYHEPTSDDHIVFCGSMDWLANREAVGFFLDAIWDRIVSRVPGARFTVIGREPPSSLVDRAKRRHENWTFTGYVDDVRPHMKGAAVSVIPMRVGGGTRLKVYEAMAVGTPIVSTSIGVEGLPIIDGADYVCADEPEQFADAVVGLLLDRERRVAIARRARQLVEMEFSYLRVARVFEEACRLAVERRRGPA